MNEQPEPVEEEQVVRLPQLMLEIQGANVDIVPTPERGEGSKAMVVGPIMLMIVMPVDGEASAAIAAALTDSNVIIAPASALQGLKR